LQKETRPHQIDAAFLFLEKVVLLGFYQSLFVMLNRRTLRIKIMQSLFAYEQCKEADYELAFDHIDARFQPDLNSMEVQDKELLARQKKAAKQLFEKKFRKPETPDHEEKIINVVIKEASELYQKMLKKDFTYFSKNLLVDVEKLSDIYYSVLGLVPALAEVAAADKKIKHDNFFNNRFVKAIANSSELTKELLKTNSGWQNRMDKVRGWFRDVLKADETYMKFLDIRKPDEESEKAVVKHVVRKLILAKGPISDYLEEENIRWAEDKDIIKGLVDKTIKSFDPATGKIELQKLSLDWDDDKEFIKTLFDNTVNLDPTYKELIAKNTKNWEVDRLPLTDRVVLEMAIAELINFPNIPVKVSINEYIELTKEYSTPNSRQFINGILDVIAKELKGSGAVKKSGRGLIDNK
jgi:N utilization substance protein B